MTILPRLNLAPLLYFFVFTSSLVSAAQIPTSQVDNARTGAYLNETVLTPQNVNPQQFGKLFTLKVDGDVYAQPLFLAGVDIPGKGRHDVLIVATEHDSVYAFDAYGNPSTPLWQVSFLRTMRPPFPKATRSASSLRPEVGITSTPVIDTRTGTIYVLARTRKGASGFLQRIPSAPARAGHHQRGGEIWRPGGDSGQRERQGRWHLRRHGSFRPLRENPRAALLLSHGNVYLSWASSCDVGPYHGWVMAYDAQTLNQKGAINVSPDADDGGIWASDTGIAADSAGNVYAATGNGRFDASQGGRDYGDTLLKLSLNGNGLAVADYFTPFNADQLNSEDNDLGSGGPMLLPDQPGPHPHLAVIGGKAPSDLPDRSRSHGPLSGGEQRSCRADLPDQGRHLRINGLLESSSLRAERRRQPA